MKSHEVKKSESWTVTPAFGAVSVDVVVPVANFYMISSAGGRSNAGTPVTAIAADDITVTISTDGVNFSVPASGAAVIQLDTGLQWVMLLEHCTHIRVSSAQLVAGEIDTVTVTAINERHHS